jgi:phage tail tube protein FII
MTYSRKEVIELHELKVKGMMKKFPSGFWKEDANKKCLFILDYVFREKFKFSDSRIKTLDNRFFIEQKLGCVLIQIGGKNYREVVNFYLREREK